MISFLHTGDLHLGLKFKNMNFTLEESKKRRLELWETFERMVDYAINKQVDFIFLTGDLYEDEYFTVGDMKKLRNILSRAEDIKVLIAAGNHDYRHKNSLYNKVDWSANVDIFSSDRIEGIVFRDLDTIVYGYSWDRINISDDSILETLKVEEGYRNKIFLLHGDLYSKSNYLPLRLEDLKSLNFEYIGLGHIHKPDIISNKIAYPGSLEPLHFGEVGPRGFIYGEIDSNGTRLEFIDYSKRKFLIEDIRIDETMSELDIEDEFNKISESSRTKDFVRVSLEGYIKSDINKEDLFTSIKNKFHYLEIIDRTILDYDLETLEDKYRDNIVGRFIREMKAKDLSLDLNKKALYYGLDVLLRGDINEDK